MKIAIDFDGTLFQWARFPDVGEPVPHALETVQALRSYGHELVLWTCRKDEGLQLAIDALYDNGIRFDHHNSCPNSDHLSVKVDADIFIDDKALGVPLITPEEGRPYVDWVIVQKLLHDLGLFD